VIWPKHSVNHEILLDTLFYYGIHGVNAQWSKSCLINGKQQVDIILKNQQQKFSFNWEQ
jgi:uncharacterized membrane protein